MRFNYLQCSHPVRAVHEEPKAQVTHTNAGRKWISGCHLGNIPFPLRGRVYIEEVPPTTYVGEYSQDVLYIYITASSSSAQSSNLSFTAGKKSNNSSAGFKIHSIWTEKDCCETVKLAAKCLFSLARLEDETASVQNQNKVGVFHMS